MKGASGVVEQEPVRLSGTRLGTNMPRVGDYNLLVVFDLIRRAKDGVSRVALANQTGLSRQTVSNVVSRLLKAGWVHEGKRLSSPGRGKPRTMLHARADAAFAVGVHVEPASISAIVMDANGGIRARGEFGWESDPARAVNSIGALVRELIEAVPADRILGLGCSVPGPIDLEQGVFVDPPTLPGWDGVQLRELVQQATGLETFMQKDSIAALAGELWNRERGLDRTTLFVYSGFGIGFAAADRGELFFGGSGNAGEGGHIRINTDDTELCTCGRQGCVGKAVEFDYLVRQAVDRGLLPPAERSHTELVKAMDQLTQLAGAGDPDALELKAKSCAAIAQAVVVVADLMDATDVIVGGSNAARLAPDLGEAVEREFLRYSAVASLHSLKVHEADFGSWVGAAGGASLVFDAKLSPSPAVLIGSDSAGPAGPPELITGIA